MLSVCFNGPHKLVNEYLKYVNRSLDVLKEVADIDACDELWQYDIEQKVHLFFTDTVNL